MVLRAGSLRHGQRHDTGRTVTRAAIRHLRTPETTWRSGNATTRVRAGRPLTLSPSLSL